MGHYSTIEEDEVSWMAHESYDHANPPKNSRIPHLISYVNEMFESESMKLKWDSDKRVYANDLGFNVKAVHLHELCGIMGFDPYEELPRIMLEEALKTSKD